MEILFNFGFSLVDLPCDSLKVNKYSLHIHLLKLVGNNHTEQEHRTTWLLVAHHSTEEHLVETHRRSFKPWRCTYLVTRLMQHPQTPTPSTRSELPASMDITTAPSYSRSSQRVSSSSSSSSSSSLVSSSAFITVLPLAQKSNQPTRGPRQFAYTVGTCT